MDNSEDATGFPEEADEVYWVLLSFLSLEPEEQLRYLPFPIPGRDDPRQSDPRFNPLISLYGALLDFWGPWEEAFDPNTEKARAFRETLKGYAIREHEDPPGAYCREFIPDIFCIEEFRSGESWQRLRQLAREALEEAGLDPHPIPYPVRFDELFEV